MSYASFNLDNLHPTPSSPSMEPQSLHAPASADQLPFLWQPPSPKPQRVFKSLYKSYVDFSEYESPSAMASPSYLAFIGAPVPPESVRTPFGFPGFTGDDGRRQLKAVDFLAMEHSRLSWDDEDFAYDSPLKPSPNREPKGSGHAPCGTPARREKENLAVPQTPQVTGPHSVEGEVGSLPRNLPAERPEAPSPARPCSDVPQILQASSSPSQSVPGPSRSSKPTCSFSLTSTLSEPLVAVPGPSTRASSSHVPSSSMSAAIAASATPSPSVSPIPDNATNNNMTPTLSEPTLRRSSRKRSAAPTATDVSALPPAKKPKVIKGAVAEPRRKTSEGAKVQATNRDGAHKTAVAGPSHQASTAGATPVASAEPEVELEVGDVETAVGGTQRPRRTGDEVKEDTVLNLPNHACAIVGCQREWNPYKHEESRAHLEDHIRRDDLHWQPESDAGLVCFFPGCTATVPGDKLLSHIESVHLALPYLCPKRCGWRTSRSGYQGQHMRVAHKIKNWKR